MDGWNPSNPLRETTMKKILLALPLFTTLALVPVSTANAQERLTPTNGSSWAHTHTHYKVYYRTCSHSPWELYGTFDCPTEVRNALCRLNDSGYETYVRKITH